jgi:hypothetical protein
MPTNLNPDIAALPLYQLDFHDGQDVGLRLALDELTQERIRQTLLQDTYPGNPAEAFRHAYAAARLVDVSKVIGARFGSDPRLGRKRTAHLGRGGRFRCFTSATRGGRCPSPDRGPAQPQRAASRSGGSTR